MVFYFKILQFKCFCVVSAGLLAVQLVSLQETWVRSGLILQYARTSTGL